MGATLLLRLPVPLTDEGVRQLCAGVQEQLTAGAVTTVVCSVGQAAGDLATADAVARLALVARRAGVGFALHDPGGDLSSLLDLLGLAALARLPGPA